MDSSQSATSVHLPETVRCLFWEYEKGQVEWPTDETLIIDRVLTNGSWSAIKWLRAEADDEVIREWLLTHNGSALSPRQLRFWQLVLNLPSKEVDAWIDDHRASVWGQRLSR